MTALRWTPDLLADLERCIAAGLPYRQIANLFAVSPSAIAAQASARGYNKIYPRDQHGRLLYEPSPLGPVPVARREPDRPCVSTRDLPGRRKCLCCGAVFASQHAGNRICPTCAPTVNEIYDPTPAHVETRGRVYG